MSSSVLEVVRKFDILAPSNVLQLLRAFVPSTLKGVFWLLLLINIRSFPLSWHFTVFRPVIALRMRYLWMRLKLSLTSKKVRKQELDKWYAAMAPVGADPFDMTTTYSAWAGPENCDFNLHLSNSCYPKVLDGARFKAALAMFPNLFPAGGWIALAGTHHHFIREILMFSPYEVRMNVGSWDSKWFYIIVRFVTHPKKKGKGKKGSNHVPTIIENGTPAPTSTFPIPALHTPATPLTSVPVTPANPVIPDPSKTDSASTVDATVKQLAKAQMLTEEPDGATLHCVAVSQLCFKQGRITIPPAIVLAMNGFCGPTSNAVGAERYSRTNPPSFWAKVQDLVRLSNVRGMTDFLRGGWKNVPEGERWWEEALGGEIERKRKVRFDVLNQLRFAMDGAREM